MSSLIWLFATCLPQGRVLSPLVFNVYPNDQLIHQKTRVLSMTTTWASPHKTEHLPPPPRNDTNFCSHRLLHSERQQNINWRGVLLAHCTNHVCLPVTRERTLSFETHPEKKNAKYMHGIPPFKSLVTRLGELTQPQCILSHLHSPTL